MDRIQLRKELESNQINNDYYSLDGGLPNEAFCLGVNNGKWEVYYSERGHKSQLRTFEREEEACKYFLDWILKIIK